MYKLEPELGGDVKVQETLQELLQRYVDEDTYSFHDTGLLEVNSIGRELETPLHLACRRNALDDAKLLLAGGARVDAQTDIGTTPLICAVFRLNPKLVKVLLDAGADAHLKDAYGKSAIDFAEEMDTEGEILGMLRSLK